MAPHSKSGEADPAADEQQRHMALLRERWETPAPVIADAVRRAVGATIRQRTRVEAGEANEVWSVATDDGHDLVVRISHWGTFGHEAWACERVRAVGVPVPVVLLVEDAVDVVDRTVAIWIHESIPGQPLHTVTDTRAADELTSRAGEHLAAIHSVVPEGFGGLDGGGRGDAASPAEALRWNEDTAVDAVEYGIPERDAEDAAALFDSLGAMLERTGPHLLHGDYGGDHVLVRGDEVVGVIDFGNAQSGDPAFDFAWWQFFWDRPGIQTSSLLRGYRQVSDPGADLEARSCLCRLSLGMRLVNYYANDDRHEAVAHTKRKFSEALDWLRARA